MSKQIVFEPTRLVVIEALGVTAHPWIRVHHAVVTTESSTTTTRGRQAYTATIHVMDSASITFRMEEARNHPEWQNGEDGAKRFLSDIEPYLGTSPVTTGGGIPTGGLIDLDSDPDYLLGTDATGTFRIPLTRP